MTSIPLIKGPAVHLGDRRKDGSNTPSRNRVEEEARSVHTDRHYDRSARSNKSQERSGRSQEGSSRSPARDGSQRGLDKDAHQKDRSTSVNSHQSDNKSQRSGRSQPRDQSPASNRSGSVQYGKLTSSLVSNPDNLVCDDCLNKDLEKNKHDRDAARRAADKEHANRTNADLKKQLEQEKEKHLEKLRLYREGVEGQNADLQAKRAAAKAAEIAEKERMKAQLADNSDLVARQLEIQQRKDRFRDDLADQLAANRDLKDKHAKEKAEIDRANHNLLIDDHWREPHQKALKDYYKNNLLGQLADNEDARKNAKDAQKEDDARYADEVRALHAKEKAERAKADAARRDVLKDELAKQLGENQDKKAQAKADKDAEDQLHRDKIAFDNDQFYKNMDKRRQMVQGHMQDLIAQKHDAELAKKLADEEAKKPQGTGLHVPQKQKKCYNCSKCKAMKPLERLNKRIKKPQA